MCEYGPFMGLSCSLNYKDNFNKFDPDIFLNILIKTAYDLYNTEGYEAAFKIYCYLIERKQQLINKTLAKESFMLNTLDGMWRLVH